MVKDPILRELVLHLRSVVERVEYLERAARAFKLKKHPTRNDMDAILCTLESRELNPFTYEQVIDMLQRAERRGAERMRERIAKEFERPLAWLCLDHGGEEAEKIVERIRALSIDEVNHE